MATSTITLGIVVTDTATLAVLDTYAPATYIDIAADEWDKRRIDAPNGAPTNIDTDSLIGTAITSFAVKNLDGANPVIVGWTDSIGAKTQSVPAYGLFLVPEVDASVDPTLEGVGGIVPCDFFFAGT